MKTTSKQEVKVKVSKGKAMVAKNSSPKVVKPKTITEKKQTPPPNPIETSSMIHLTKHQCLPLSVIYMFLKTTKNSQELTPSRVGKVLQRMHKSGKICRLHNGVYCTTKFHKQVFPK